MDDSIYLDNCIGTNSNTKGTPKVAPLDALVTLFNRLKTTQPDLLPGMILIDGNGLLHPRAFGLACHFGVVVNIPTIGVAKNIFVFDGLSKEKAYKRATVTQVSKLLIGDSGQTHGAAVWAKPTIQNPVFVSIGHRVSLSSAIDIVVQASFHRIPEPIRQADLRSREIVREWRQKDHIDRHENRVKIYSDSHQWRQYCIEFYYEAKPLPGEAGQLSEKEREMIQNEVRREFHAATATDNVGIFIAAIQ